MPQSHSRLYDNGDIAASGDVAAACVAAVARAPSSLRDARRQIDTLMSINAHLVREIAELRKREAQAQRLAERDGLTGTYNRAKMLDLLQGCVTAASQQNQRVAVLFIDLDGFKRVNDTHGHQVGDQLLISVAARIAARARIGDFVCRFGGDEFVVILPSVADAAAADKVAASIRRRVGLPYRIDGIAVEVTAAVGVAVYPDQAGSAAALLHVADQSMYRAKWQGPRPGGAADGISAPSRRREDDAATIARGKAALRAGTSAGWARDG